MATSDGCGRVPRRLDSGSQSHLGGAPVSEERRGQVAAQINEAYPELAALYQQFHAHPELSLHEEMTSERLARELEQLGFNVPAAWAALGWSVS
jgi:hypothetical protein